MNIKKMFLLLIVCLTLTPLVGKPIITLGPPGQNQTNNHSHKPSRIDQIKRIANLNNDAFDIHDNDPGNAVFYTLINNHKYCLKHWDMKNYLAAFVCKSLPLNAAPYSTQTHFYLNDQQQCYISQEVQQLIFDQYPLYQSPEFCAALHYLPDYQQQIERVHKTMCVNSRVNKQLGVGRAYVQQAYHAIEQRKREQHAREQYAEKLRTEQLAHQRHVSQVQSVFKQQEQALHNTLKHNEGIPALLNNDDSCQRIHTRQIAIKNALEQPSYTTSTYALTHKQAALLADYGITSSHYTQLVGNQLQHHIHKELLVWLHDAHNRIEHISDHQWLGAFIDTAYTANKLGRCVEPLFILDFAWTAIDALASCEPPVFESEYLTALCAAAVHLAKVDKQIVQLCKDGNFRPFITGAWQGVTSVATLLRHPIDSFASMAHHLSKIISRLDEVPNLLLSGNSEQAHEKAVDIVDDFIQFQIDAARAFVATPEEQVVTHATALAVETVALQGCGKAVSTLANKAVTVIKNSEHAEQIANTAHKLAKRVQHAYKEVSAETAVTAEGIEMAGAEIAQAEAIGGGTQLNTIPKYISKTVSYILADEPAILALAEKFKTFKLLQYTQEFGFEYVQITEKYLKHIFGIEIEEIVKKSGLVKRRLGGFHHDYLGTLEKSGKIEVIAKKINDLSKISELDMLFEGILIEGKTFFPSYWTQEECLKNIIDSLNNLIKQPILQENGKWKLIGATKDGITIETIVKTTGELVTSYPIF